MHNFIVFRKQLIPSLHNTFHGRLRGRNQFSRKKPLKELFPAHVNIFKIFLFPHSEGHRNHFDSQLSSLLRGDSRTRVGADSDFHAYSSLLQREKTPPLLGFFLYCKNPTLFFQKTLSCHFLWLRDTHQLQKSRCNICKTSAFS